MKSPKTRHRFAPGNKHSACLTPEEVAHAVALLRAGHSQRAVAAELNVTYSTIGWIARGVTHKEITRGRLFPPERRLTPDEVAAIRAALAAGTKRMVIAQKHRVSSSTIYCIASGKTHKPR